MIPPFVKQTWTASGVLLNMLGQGMVLSFPSCLIPGLRHPDSPIQADLATASSLASCVGLSSMLGFIISSFLMDVWGRKISHALVIIPGTMGWLFIYFATNIPLLMTGRVLGGITAGATVTLGAVVIGEYTSPQHRGMFLNLKTAAVCLGSMIVHILGYYFHWRSVALFALTPHILAFVIVCTWPESPAWLAARKQYVKSETAFFWLRGTNDESVREFEDMIRAQKERSNVKTSLLENLKGFFGKFLRRDFVKPVFIVLLGAILLESSARHIFPSYAPDIIGAITGDKSQSFYYIIGLDIIITVSATFSSFLVKVMKRRSLLFSTGVASLAVLLCVCVYLYLAHLELIVLRSWVALSMFIIYFILANLGCTPIPYAFLGEVFPLAHRSAGSAVSGLALSFTLMIALKITPYMLKYLHLHGTFLIFGGVTGLVLLLLFFVLPETKDRTLQEIEDYFNYGEFDARPRDDVEVNLEMIREKT